MKCKLYGKNLTNTGDGCQCKHGFACKQCGNFIDDDTIEFFLQKSRRLPRHCGACIARAMFEFIEEEE